MSIRFCSLDCEVTHCDKVCLDDASVISKPRIFLTRQNKLIDVQNTKRSHISNIPVVLNSNLFLDAHDQFYFNSDLRYIPVVTEKGVFVCFCYEDFDIEKNQEDTLELLTFDGLPPFSPDYHIIIWGFNEIAYNFHLFLEKQKVKHSLKGELWQFLVPDYTNEMDSALPTRDFFAEGNHALPIKDGAYGKTALEWKEDDWEILINYYRRSCKYDNVLSKQDMQKSIANIIRSGEPFMLARIGNTEISILKEYLAKKKGLLRRYSYFWLDYLYHCCGFFSNDVDEVVDEHVDAYSEMTLEALKNCDFQVCWGHESLAAGLNFILHQYESKYSKRIDWDYLDSCECCFDPVLGYNALRGKKVLVISPFVNTIKEQYARKELIFQGEKQFPDCDLILYRAPETQMGQTLGFHTWFECFQSVVDDISRIDFDIAIIGAGSYGMPLAYEIKKMKKQAISISSYLANWFGIKMKRYCTYSKLNRNWNEHWVFPSEDPPPNYELVEDGCYWR